MSESFYAVMWEADFRRALKIGARIGCDNDWRPAPYTGCRCHSCRLVREIAPDAKEYR